MNFVQSNLAKKLIIVLIVLLLFNVVYPSMSFAADFGGILLSPLYYLNAALHVPFDIILGSVMVLPHFSFTDVSLWTAYVVNPLNFVADKLVNLWDSIANLFRDKDKTSIDIGKEIGDTKLNKFTVARIFGKGNFYEDGQLVQRDYRISDLFIGPDTIFKGDLVWLNANIFKHVNNAYDESDDFIENLTPWEKASVAVAKFYVILRNICAIIMLAGLIFTGIRILLSANIPTKKTQYLMLLQDWLIGMAILIFSHIIMILILDLAEQLTVALGKSLGMGGIKWYTISMMMYSDDSVAQIIAMLLYSWIQVLTIVFAISYFKRFFWTCILVVFAPIFCVMYAFGQQTKQIYTNWLKEFIMNAMVQPFHLILYSVLLTVPFSIAAADEWNWSFQNGHELAYALMAMSMIKPAEKYLRKLFNMDRGIAAMASYDSGMKDIKAAGKAVATVAKAAVGIAATVATAGAAAGAIGAAGAASAAGGAAGAAGGAGAAGEAGGAMLEGGLTDIMGSQGGDAFNMLQNGTDLLGESTTSFDNNPYVLDDGLSNINDYSLGTQFDSFDTGDQQALNRGFDESIDELGDKVGSEEKEKAPQSLEGDQKSEDSKDNGGKNNVIEAANVTLNAGSVSMGENAGNNENAEIKTIEAENAAIEAGDNNSSDDGISLDMPEMSFGEVFKNLGGLEQLGSLGADLFEGMGSITDGLYVDGTAPTAERNADAQWLRGNIKQAGDKRKENMDRAKDNWANNKENISIMADKYMPEMGERYKGKPEAYIRMKAEEKAKSALKDMSAYVPYGATDVNVAYELYQNANKNGLSPEQSVKNMAGFSKFNSSSANVGQINLSGAFSRNDYTEVKAAIPEAKTYYDAGITNVNDMAWVDYMAQKLGKSPEFAMKVDEALKKKGKGGKLSYNGKDGEMKKVIDQINSHYGG